ncbi:MAG: CCA tRNA nucleotidyltransferase [Alphaproteobacteria bacterium]
MIPEDDPQTAKSAQAASADSPVATVDPAVLLSAYGGSAAALIDILGGDARFVGGCVRDMVLGQFGEGDIDIATPLHPNNVTRRLTRANWKAIPVGIEHGTVLAVAPEGGGTFEVTTLREDVETDGRHARVRFTDNWKQDAARRDFTYNALSVDRHGYLYDYFGGLEDLEGGYTRFVGNASDRIAEDRLRILRAYRFHARFGLREWDGATARALQAQAHELENLSGERIRQEMGKLLLGPSVIATLQLMSAHGVLAHIIPSTTHRFRSDDFGVLDRLMVLEDLHDRPGLWRRLAALLHRDEDRMKALAKRYKISNRDRDALMGLSSRVPAKALNWALYLDGPDAALDRLLLDAAEMNAPASGDYVNRILSYQPTVLPISGQDALDLGMAPGPLIGQLIRRVEAWWVERDFQPSREECLWELSHAIKADQDPDISGRN